MLYNLEQIKQNHHIFMPCLHSGKISKPYVVTDGFQSVSTLVERPRLILDQYLSNIYLSGL